MSNTLKFGEGKWATKEGSALAYNDENNNFKPLPFDFTRASSATRVNEDGLIEVVGIDKPRIDYLGNSNGALLLEPSRSNVLPYSSDFSQWSTASGASVVGNKLGVGGSNDAFEFFSDGTSSTRLFYTLSITGESSYSVFAKKNTLDYISLYANDDNDARVWFNLDNGTLGNQEGGGTGVIEDYGNGWYRCTLKWTPSNLVNVRIYNSNENDVIGGTAGSVYIQYAQLEVGSYATSYIPTQGSAVTRLGDVCNNGANEQVINSTEGVLYFEAKVKTDPSFAANIIAVSDGTDANRLSIIMYGNINSIRSSMNVGGVSQFDFYLSGSYSREQYYKIALSYKVNDCKIFVNGTKSLTVTSATMPSLGTFDRLNLDLGNGLYDFYGNVKDIKLYNTALTDAELQALTS